MSRLTLQKRYDSTQCRKDLYELEQRFDFITVHTIGYSVLGVPILELLLGRGAKHIHWNGAFHANEWITSPLLLKVVEDYAEAVQHGCEEALKLFEGTTLSVVPMVNPDGVNLFMHGSQIGGAYQKTVEQINHMHATYTSWKANIRGVDLNNQFPAHWDIEKGRKPAYPTFRDYPGEEPLTEPEARAMYNLTVKREFDRVLAFHSQGEVIYWGYQQLEPSHAEKVVTRFEEVSGYSPVHTIDSYAGYKDWFIQEFKREGYTVEVGKGINPLPWSTFAHQYRKVREICFQSLEM